MQQENQNIRTPARKSVWLVFAAAGLLMLWAAVSFVQGIAAASASTLTVESIAMPPNTASAPVSVSLTTDDTVATISFEIDFDPTLVDFVPPAFGGSGGFLVCNVTEDDGVNPDTLSCSYANPFGITGTDLDVGTINWSSGAAEGVSPLDTSVSVFSDPSGSPLDPPAIVDGQITVGNPVTPTPTNTPVPPTPTPTNTPIPPTATPTNTPIPPTATPTNTPIPPTATPTNTPIPPTVTPTNTPIPPTVTPTNTPIPPTVTPTNTPIPPTVTPTGTPVPPTATPTGTPVPPTATPTNTPVPPTVTPTNTPVPPTPTPTNTPEPTFVEMASMSADLNADGSVSVSWTTSAEINNAGFMVWRSDSADSIGTAITTNLIASAASAGSGASYSYVDAAAGDGTATYWVEAIETNGTSEFHGPVSASDESPTSASLTGLVDGGGSALLPFALAGMLVALIAGAVVMSRRRSA